MSLRLSAAAVRTYDALKSRPNARPRVSDARDLDTLEAINRRLNELVSSYRLSGHAGPAGQTYVFWTEVNGHISSGAFDDLLDRL